MSFKFTLGLTALALCLSACETTSQYTSGADYLAQYPAQTTYESSLSASTSSFKSTYSKTDAAIRDIAAVEPDLHFPARIGLARIDRQNLIGVPHDEAESWRAAAESLGPGFGAFIPVSPLVADMVAPKDKGTRITVVEHIRRGAARQHLDYVIAYEVTDTSDSGGNALRLADLTVLGLFVLPSRDLKAEASASAILLDVRNGYPYLTGSTFADKKSISTVVGSWDRRQKLKDKARVVAVSNIAEEFADGLRELKLVADGMKLAESRPAHSAALNR